MTEDPFSSAPFYEPTCPECRARGGGHFIGCELMAREIEKRQKARNGVCPRCHLVRPCGCEDPS
jgi:hypothetical protein